MAILGVYKNHQMSQNRNVELGFSHLIASIVDLRGELTEDLLKRAFLSISNSNTKDDYAKDLDLKS